METGPDALDTAKNESGSVKHENGSRRPWYSRKRVRERKTWIRDPTPSKSPKTSTGVPNMKTGPGAQKMKTGPDALRPAENESGSAKHENGT
jgi:hypothetical protein